MSYPDEKNTEHMGDGVYATFDGFGLEIRINDHRSEAVAYMEPAVVAALSQFLERKRQEEI
jgi:hypothetical protein